MSWWNIIIASYTLELNGTQAEYNYFFQFSVKRVPGDRPIYNNVKRTDITRAIWPKFCSNTLRPVSRNSLTKIVSCTAPLTSKYFILYIYSTNTSTENFKHDIYSSFLSLQNEVCFIILTYLVPVLFTFYIKDVLKLKKIIPALKG